MPNARKGKKGPPAGSQRSKTAGKTAVSPINGAEIPLGAHPGNTGGKPGRSGRLPSAVRTAALEEFATRVPRIAAIADGNVPLTETCPKCGYQAKDGGFAVPPDVGDMLRAHDMLGKYGLGERGEFSPDVVSDNVDRMLTFAETLMAPDDFTAFAQFAASVWNDA